MGKKNVVTKQFLGDNKNFADIFNYFLYQGKQVINPKGLKEKDPTELIAFITEDNDTVTKEKFRDVLKRCIIKESDECMFVLLGIEAQSEVHYAMPVRNGLYDFLDYSSQVQKIEKKHKKNKDVYGKEFLSKYTKSDKIIPVITLTLYLGSEEWDGPRSLYEMFDVKDPEILKYVSDYKLNLLIPNEVENPELFTTSMKYIMSFFKAGRNKDEIRKLIEENEKEYSSLNPDAAMLLHECAGIDFEMIEGEEGVDVCKGLLEWGESERREGREEGRVCLIIKLYCNKKLSKQDAIEELSITEDEFQQLLDKKEEPGYCCI